MVSFMAIGLKRAAAHLVHTGSRRKSTGTTEQRLSARVMLPPLETCENVWRRFCHHTGRTGTRDIYGGDASQHMVTHSMASTTKKYQALNDNVLRWRNTTTAGQGTAGGDTQHREIQECHEQ